MNEPLERVDELIERSFRGEIVPAERQQLESWRRASLANERHYRQLVRLLEGARRLALPSPAGAPPNATDVIARRAGVAAGHTVRRWIPWLTAAAAVALALGAWIARTPAPTAILWGATDVVTGRAEMATLQLPDGSVVRLAPASRLRFAEALDKRAVTLDGRAFFAVTKVPGRPFVVRTRYGNATVLGTRFELLTEEDSLRLVVVEGRVALTTDSNHVEVLGGESSSVRQGTARAPVRVADPGRMERWVGKFLVFQSTPMDDVARDVEQLYSVRVVLADSTIARRTISAAFTDKSVDDVLRVICTIAVARCGVQGDAFVVASQ